MKFIFNTEKDASTPGSVLCSINIVKKKRSINFSLKFSQWRAFSQRERSFLLLSLPFSHGFWFRLLALCTGKEKTHSWRCFGARSRQTEVHTQTHTCHYWITTAIKEKIYPLFISKDKSYCLQEMWAKEESKGQTSVYQHLLLLRHTDTDRKREMYQSIHLPMWILDGVWRS